MSCLQFSSAGTFVFADVVRCRVSRVILALARMASFTRVLHLSQRRGESVKDRSQNGSTAKGEFLADCAISYAIFCYEIHR